MEGKHAWELARCEDAHEADVQAMADLKEANAAAVERMVEPRTPNPKS
jgi:hypothetical protein